VIAAIVAALHLGIFAVFVLSTRSGGSGPPPSAPLRLLMLPAIAAPKIRAANLPERTQQSERFFSVPTPALGTLPALPSSSGADGRGTGVDWSAEARRALQAFEIRTKEGSGTPANAGQPQDQGWWPHAQHHAGEQYKTDTGDWIVWINANCYQVAHSATTLAVPGANLPSTICPEGSRPRGDLFKDLPSYKPGSAN